MSPVDRSAAIGFGRAAAAYERGRPGYPPSTATTRQPRPSSARVSLLRLADGSADAVLVAQAFHWFDVEAAAAEITRVLVPSGGLGVIRNSWDRSVAWVSEVQSLIDGNRPKSSRIDGWRERWSRPGGSRRSA